MISITRAGYDSEKPSGSRILNELNTDKYDSPISIKRIIVIRKIDPAEFEDEVSNMSEREEDNLSQEELDALLEEIPAEADSMSDEELGEDEEEDIDGSTEGGEVDNTDKIDMTEEEIAALEKEIPPEVDHIKDDELEGDEDLDDDETGEKESEEVPVEKETKPSKEDVKLATEDLDEGTKINDYI